ncbi:uncharacterized protein LOC142170432 [Nicotiana tabacum]|uniref:Uncharacterized protein LOC142170432 n=1 Tax=Nicotiana tabacum TaxID=4097 RepID=A0AC58STZ4_TOBAC
MANTQNTRVAGALPSDIEKNPQVNAVMLRNGRELVEVPKKKKEQSGLEEERVPKFVEIHLNIPLVDMLREVPKDAKYIKDIVENKNRLTEFETIILTEECTCRIQHKLSQKHKDPGSFTIPVRIDEIDLVYRSYVYPKGVIEDVLLQIGKFIFPIDFIILDYEADELVPIILG